eukprot:XP_025015337.1 uncharacterized protein LOC112536724 [Ricinus communis]
MVMLWKHLALFLNQPVNDATIGMSYEWYWWSYSDGPPPSPPFSKLLGVSGIRAPVLRAKKNKNKTRKIASSSSSAPAAPTFNGSLYHLWSMKMKTYLKSQGLWKVVETDEDPPALRPNPTVAQLRDHEEQLLRKDKALTCIHSSLADHVFTSIMDLETPKAVWDYLKERFEGTDRVKAVKILTLKREFELLKMKDDELVKDYSSRMMDLVNQIRLYGKALPDQRVVEKIMVSVPRKFEAKISAIKESCDLQRLTVVELISKLVAQEQRSSMRDEETAESAFFVSHKGKKPNTRNRRGTSYKNRAPENSSSKQGKLPPCSIGKKTNHAEKDCWYKDGEKPKYKCNFCNKIGHTEKFCRAKKAQQAQTQAQEQVLAAKEEKSHPREHLFMASQANKTTQNYTWLIDNGCTSHMTPDATSFTSLDKSITTRVKLGDGSTVQARGRGSISVNTKKGYKIFELNNKRIELSRDMSFDESSFWNWNSHEVEKHELLSLLAPTFEVEEEENVNDELFDVHNTSDTQVLKTRPLAEVYKRCNFIFAEPANFDEASKHPEWIEAMKAEIQMIEKNNTWLLTELPQNKQAIGVKWVFRTKYNPDGSINKLKARLVVKGYAQVAGSDYGDTFAPVARHDTIKLLLSFAAQMGWKVFHLDVKSAFLNGELKEELYIEQPEGFQMREREDEVYKLRKALYGLKQAPRAWYQKIDAHLMQQGFKRNDNEATLYLKQEDGELKIVVSLYVDDLLVTGSQEEAVSELKKQMESVFEMFDLGLMNYFLGMEIHQCSSGIFISQKKYALDVLKKFKLEACKEVVTQIAQNEKLSKNDGEKLENPTVYRSIVGSLLYLSTTRSDLMYPASLLSRFLSYPTSVHLGVAKKVLKFLKGTVKDGIWYHRLNQIELQGYADSDWAGSVDDMKSTSGYVFSLGSGAICWNSKKQEVVAQSTAEAEYVSIAAASNQAIWLRKLLSYLCVELDKPTTIYCDNKSAIAIAENPVQHGRTKHINVKFHSIREAEKNLEIKLQHCSSEEQLTDLFTKPLSRPRIDFLKNQLGASKTNLKEECWNM